MPRDDATLTYESGSPWALGSDERVIWEGHPYTPLHSFDQRRAVAALVLIPLATAILMATASDGNVLATFIFTTLMAVLTLLAIAATKKEARAQRAVSDKVSYQLTNQRLMQRDERTGRRSFGQAWIEEISKFELVRAKRATFTIDEVTLTNLADPDPLVVHMLALWAASGRRAKVRRMNGNSTMPGRADHDPNQATPPGIVLASDERVLWVGRPRRRTFVAWAIARLQTLAWLLIPIAVLGWSTGFSRVPDPGSMVVAVLMALWLLGGIYRLTVAPFVEARKRNRSTYILTNIRAIHFEAGRKTIERSLLLDLVHRVAIEQTSQDVATVWIEYEGFTDLEAGEARRLHGIALAAVRTAGTAKPIEVMPPGSATSPQLPTT